MKCPFCKRTLVPGENRRYETLCDHVSDPNCTSHPLRPTFVCTCELAKGIYWDEQGDYYTSVRTADEIRAFYKVRDAYGDKLDRGSLHAIGSFSWKFVRERRRQRWVEKWVPFYTAWRRWRWNRLAKKYHWLAKEV